MVSVYSFGCFDAEIGRFVALMKALTIHKIPFNRIDRISTSKQQEKRYFQHNAPVLQLQFLKTNGVSSSQYRYDNLSSLFVRICGPLGALSFLGMMSQYMKKRQKKIK